MSKPAQYSSPMTTTASPRARPLRIVASGTLFLTHQLSLPSYPGEGSIARARTVTRTRGGSAANVLAALGQFAGVEALLVAPLAGNSEGAALVRDLARERVNTRHCRIWEGTGVPSTWVFESEETGSRTVINHNPLPDITHEEFVSLLGPLLVPENYEFANVAGTPASTPPAGGGNGPQNLSPAPFEWLHFEGRSVKTTLSNITGIDGLARERRWRNHCVFSLDACKVRQGVEALIPHVDVIFFSKQYAISQNAAYTTPRPFLLALASSGRVPQHALLVAYWGSAGAALLSVPTREYLQSSGWVDDEPPAMRPLSTISESDTSTGVPNVPGAVNATPSSVRSGSGFWAAGHRTGSGTSSSAFTAFSGSAAHSSGLRDSSGYSFGHGLASPTQMGNIPEGRVLEDEEEDPDADAATEVGKARGENGTTGKDRKKQKKDANDEAVAQDAFIAGMIYSLSQRILPGAPYTPASAIPPHGNHNNIDLDRGRWRLEDCLRFASEYAGRRARNKDFFGLAEEMQRAGWFD